ncbi:SIR2 family protein [Streptomyces rhizosphaerihabitans]|uniref:SIR2 family protein n=1 Tax=Streptomyces rhizosphaerihabitans TaxID=1266770 RepID=UPI0021C1B4B3|nr:SIR2 family protein [Streptomyces rhizosphaerihabitans]MCT9011527.1 SIR2 family protein [Streptomyces rhizosphaerihabitans]
MVSTSGTPTPLQTLAHKTSEPVVLLCGSGVSSVPPSSVPSWYGLNAAALDGIRDLALAHVLDSTSAQAAAAAVSVQDVSIVSFSQVLSDAFAGRGWLDILSILDSDTPNAVHRAIAELISEGRCHCIVTTNFDTLLEQACKDAGLDVLVRVPGRPAVGIPVDGRPAIHKIHGCVQQPASMIDLLLDKGRGLSPSTQSSLAAACHDGHLLVLGFSGDDFAVNHDYLGLIAHDALPKRVTWIVRPGSQLTAGASAFLDALAQRGADVAVEEYQLLDLIGARSTGNPQPDDAQRLVDHVRDWLVATLVFPPTAALVLTQLLRLRGDLEAAATMRAEIRLALPRFEQDVRHIASTPAAWALLGKEEGTGQLALDDLRRADEAMDRCDQFAALRNITWREQAQAEQILLRAGIRQNASIVYLRAGNVSAAERALDSAAQILRALPGIEKTRRMAGINYNQAFHALARNNLSHAMILMESSIKHAVDCGDLPQQASSLLMLSMCLRTAGDSALAAQLDHQATQLGTTHTHASARGTFERLLQSGGTALASGMLDDLAASIAPDPLLSALASARSSHDAVAAANLLRDIVDRDLSCHGSERLGQLLRSLELTLGAPATQLYQQIVRTLNSTAPAGWPTQTRFLLTVTQLGLDQTTTTTPPQSTTVDQLRRIGALFNYQPSYFVPPTYITGLRIVTLPTQASPC